MYHLFDHMLEGVGVVGVRGGEKGGWEGEGGLGG